MGQETLFHPCAVQHLDHTWHSTGTNWSTLISLKKNKDIIYTPLGETIFSSDSIATIPGPVESMRCSLPDSKILKMGIVWLYNKDLLSSSKRFYYKEGNPRAR